MKILEADDITRGMYVTIVSSRPVVVDAGQGGPSVTPFGDFIEPWNQAEPRREPKYLNLHGAPLQVIGVDLPYIRLQVHGLPKEQKKLARTLIVLLTDVELGTWKREMWDNPHKRKRPSLTREEHQARKASRRKLIISTDDYLRELQDIRNQALYGKKNPTGSIVGPHGEGFNYPTESVEGKPETPDDDDDEPDTEGPVRIFRK